MKDIVFGLFTLTLICIGSCSILIVQAIKDYAPQTIIIHQCDDSISITSDDIAYDHVGGGDTLTFK